MWYEPRSRETIFQYQSVAIGSFGQQLFVLTAGANIDPMTRTDSGSRARAMIMMIFKSALRGS